MNFEHPSAALVARATVGSMVFLALIFVQLCQVLTRLSAIIDVACILGDRLSAILDQLEESARKAS
jgi:hypothetical protein